MSTVEIGGHLVRLLPQKAALLVESRTLLVADAHIGKAATFRRLGVPVPRGTTSETLGVLADLVAHHEVQRIVFLGDFLHSAHARAAATLDAVARWRAAHRTLALTLVRGNHDDRAGDPPASLGFEVVDEPLRVGGLALCHHPRPRTGVAVLAGHLHPGVVVARGFERLRLPCFHLGANGVGVLPAFGAFTGLHVIEPAPGDRIFAVADDAVTELPAPRATA